MDEQTATGEGKPKLTVWRGFWFFILILVAVAAVVFVLYWVGVWLLFGFG